MTTKLYQLYPYCIKYSLLELAVTKDNPAFSMINDSDEEVVYGSEDESRRPLNSGGKNDYDSD